MQSNTNRTKRSRTARGTGPAVLVSALCLLTALGGCSKPLRTSTPPPEKTLSALFTEEPVTVDGILDEPVWKAAPVYQLLPAMDRAGRGEAPAEAGEVRIAWDDQALYLCITFLDTDIVAEGGEDQMHHYRLGDLVELFLKPDDRPGTWELYATPRGRKTSFWLPRKGTITDGANGLRVAARSEGTLNRSGDRDRRWTAEMAMPLETLASPYPGFRPGSRWRILVARYNYGRTQPDPELSSVPQLSRTDFHMPDEYAVLDWIRADPVP